MTSKEVNQWILFVGEGFVCYYFKNAIRSFYEIA
jgi:hypothetical protein